MTLRLRMESTGYSGKKRSHTYGDPTAFYIIASGLFGMDRRTFGFLPAGIEIQGIGMVGMMLNFAVTGGVIRFFPPPSDATRKLVDRIREPEDAEAAVKVETPPGIDSSQAACGLVLNPRAPRNTPVCG